MDMLWTRIEFENDRKLLLKVVDGNTLVGSVTVSRDSESVNVYNAAGLPLATWHYADHDGDERLVNRTNRPPHAAHTGGGVMVDIVELEGVQEIWNPTGVCLTITPEAIAYRAYNNLEFDRSDGNEDWDTQDFGLVYFEGDATLYEHECTPNGFEGNQDQCRQCGKAIAS